MLQMLTLISILLVATAIAVRRALGVPEELTNLPVRPRDYYSGPLSIVRTITRLALKHVPFTGVAPLPQKLKIADEPYVELPHQIVSAPYRVDPDDIALFRRLAGTLGESHVDRLVLAPLAVPLIPAILSSRLNPLMPLGSVNVRNTFKWYPAVKQLLEGKAAQVVAEAGGSDRLMQARRVKRGLEWDTLLRITSEGSQKPVFEFTFTSLNAIPRHRLSSAIYTKTAEASNATWINDPPPLVMAAGGPSLYASLSRDYNPIHMSSILAKAFGFKRKIAHGNLVIALACQRAASGDADPTLNAAKATFAGLLNNPQGSTLNTFFKRPVFVPSTVYLRWSEDGTRAEVYQTVKGEVKVLVELHVQ